MVRQTAAEKARFTLQSVERVRSTHEEIVNLEEHEEQELEERLEINEVGWPSSQAIEHLDPEEL